MADLLTLSVVTRRFGRRTAVDAAKLILRDGCAVCLTGPNGAGKTTLVAIAAGVLRPDSGHVLVFGKRLDHDVRLRRRIGYMADRPLLYEALTGRENLTFHAQLYGVGSAATRVGELLDRVGLADRGGDAVSTYSAGMRRRLDLARVLLHDPAVLLLDEPANSLDAEGQRTLEKVLADYRSPGRAVLATAHDVDRARAWADEVLTITGGRLAPGRGGQGT